MTQTALRVCRATLFFLSHNQDAVFETCPQFAVDPLERVAKPIANAATLLLWTHRLLRALARKTWGEGPEALRQLVATGRDCDVGRRGPRGAAQSPAARNRLARRAAAHARSHGGESERARRSWTRSSGDASARS